VVVGQSTGGGRRWTGQGIGWWSRSPRGGDGELGRLPVAAVRDGALGG
jgi:hypothetical protein